MPCVIKPIPAKIRKSVKPKFVSGDADVSPPKSIRFNIKSPLMILFCSERMAQFNRKNN
jgi:hypothetical protein